MVEDKAVDLYVLERAFVSSHEHSEELVRIATIFFILIIVLELPGIV